MRKKKKGNWITWICIIAGLILCLSTLFLPLADQMRQSEMLKTYEEKADQVSDAQEEEMLEKAREYNSLLYQTEKAGIQLEGSEILTPQNYLSLLDYSDGMMGTLEIPKISVSYPIYHGVSEEILAKGIGHLEDFSLPVGGENTHAVLTGHRGLPSSKLLTRLDEMKEGDLFFIRTGSQTLAYQVSDIRVISPEDVDSLVIEDGKDQVSLITCTPYGLNTHRLVVTGDRVPYSEKQQKSVTRSFPSVQEFLRICVPCFLISVLLLYMILRR